MRKIDADELIRNLEGIISDYTNNGIYPEKFDIDDFIDVVKEMPTILAPQWISVEDRLPKLPDRDWCSVMVITAKRGDVISHHMVYERAIVRGKRVERWKYYWDRIADEPPDYWMPMPDGPEEV